jgi:hypothetical protein
MKKVKFSAEDIKRTHGIVKILTQIKSVCGAEEGKKKAAQK